MNDFMGDRRASAAQWFALAALVLTVASMAGARTLNWLSQSGRVALVAYRAPAPTPNARAAADVGVDLMPTGSIPSSALMIRIR